MGVLAQQQQQPYNAYQARRVNDGNWHHVQGASARRTRTFQGLDGNVDGWRRRAIYPRRLRLRTTRDRARSRTPSAGWGFRRVEGADVLIDEVRVTTRRWWRGLGYGDGGWRWPRLGITSFSIGFNTSTLWSRASSSCVDPGRRRCHGARVIAGVLWSSI